MITQEENPLLGNSGLPHFDRILPEHVGPAVDSILKTCEAVLANLEKSAKPTWENLVEPLESMRRSLHSTWSPVQHLIGVKNSPALRDAYEKALPKIVSFSLRLSQSKELFQSFKQFRNNQDWNKLNRAQQRAIESHLLNAKLSGIELEGAAQERFNEISQRLSQLQTSFSNHVLDATKAYQLLLTDPSDVADIPETFRAIWADQYQSQHPDKQPVNATNGPWLVTLNFASYMPFLKYCNNRQLRQEVYKAYVTRASVGNFDNTPIMKEILSLRLELAKLLGFQSFAEVSLASKMAGNVETVEQLLHDLSKVSTQKARLELNDLESFAHKNGLQDQLQNWDIYFYLEKLRQEKFNFSDDELRPYFPLDRVLTGLFRLLENLFGIKVVPSTEKVTCWHKDVLYYEVQDENNSTIAAFYLDPYARPEEKRGGAWMDTCLDRGLVNGKKINPVAYLVCNGTPPVGDTPSLLSFEEVETLFHEFGHGLQHMLTKVDYLDVTGINGIEWDAVELPSQFMENWCYQKTVVQNLTKHIKTGKHLPDELFEKIHKAKTFNAANLMVRQLHFAMVDMELHHRSILSSEGESLDSINRRIASKVCAIQPISEDRSLCTFEHIFAGSYAAGYYSYKWAEVLSADAFSRFEDEGLDDANVARVGRDFKETVLALGGSQHPLEVFRMFRGREPKVDALLRHNDLNT